LASAEQGGGDATGGESGQCGENTANSGAEVETAAAARSESR
jgi:hypothetical protein